MKKVMSLLMVVALLAIIGCGKDDGRITLDMRVNYGEGEVVHRVLGELIEEYEALNPDIKINYESTPDYEAAMNARMASNDLPDIFTTHGWSVMRYSEYLEPLTNEPWVEELIPAIKPVITNKNGDIFVFTPDADISGIVYNRTVIDNAGIDIDEILTWNDFMNACEKISETGVVPVRMAGKDSWGMGQYFDWMTPAIFTSDKRNYHGDDLKAGKMDVELMTLSTNYLKELHDKGLINPDAVTASFDEVKEALATDEAAFAFYGNYAITGAEDLNPDVKLGFFPLPAWYEGGERVLITGERNAIGIWKDSEHKEEAKELLKFLAKPENVSKLASANGIPAGIRGVSSDTGSLKGDYEKYSDIEGAPFFDRVYLPSGMWNSLCTAGSSVLSGEATPKIAAERLVADYNKLSNKK